MDFHNDEFLSRTIQTHFLTNFEHTKKFSNVKSPNITVNTEISAYKWAQQLNLKYIAYGIFVRKE